MRYTPLDALPDNIKRAIRNLRANRIETAWLTPAAAPHGVPGWSYGVPGGFPAVPSLARGTGEVYTAVYQQYPGPRELSAPVPVFDARRPWGLIAGIGIAAVAVYAFAFRRKS